MAKIADTHYSIYMYRLLTSTTETEAAQLHLVVGAAEEHEPARPRPSAGGRRCGASAPWRAEQARDEPGRRQARPAGVAAGHAGACQVQLAGHHPRVAQVSWRRRARTPSCWTTGHRW